MRASVNRRKSTMSHGKFTCDYCDRNFSRKYNLKNHIENMHLNLTSKCTVCHQTFGTSPGYLLHMSRGHNRKGEPFPECDICGRIFTRRQNIISHMFTIHRNVILSPKGKKKQGLHSNLKCPSCFKIFTTECSLRRHIKELHDFDYNNSNVCILCNKVFKRKYGLHAHIQSCHSGKIKLKQCPMCHKSYVSKSHLKRHIELIHGQDAHALMRVCELSATNSGEGVDDDSNIEDVNNSFDCKQCNIEFDSEILLRQHLKLDHSFETYYNYCKSALKKYSESNCLYACEFCDDRFKHSNELRYHLKLKHNTEFSFSNCFVCYEKFYTEEAILEHKKNCSPPKNSHRCSNCEKIFTELTSLEFHSLIFHPQLQVADPDISSTNNDESASHNGILTCKFCKRVYYSEKTLKHHIKLKHTTDEAIDCQYCGKIYNNKYYLASHIKQIHNSDDWLKCDYCDKQFRSKRNIRHHIEYTHMGMQRYKCIECETLFKEKRSLRKHVRRKHATSTLFPQCHICNKRFESAKSCKIHLKLLHSYNIYSHPCHLCSVSFSSDDALQLHLNKEHLAENEIYKCDECNMILQGQETFEQHMDLHRVTPSTSRKSLPRCILCVKDFSTRKTLKRHIKKFHEEFDVKDLANCGSINKNYNVDCEECMKSFVDERYWNMYQNIKNDRYARVFKCEFCSTAYNPLDFAIQRYKLKNNEMERSKTIMSGLCTAEMSDENDPYSEFGKLHQLMEPESTTVDIKVELIDADYEINGDLVKLEPMSP